jgi:acyl-CoA oxidase
MDLEMVRTIFVTKEGRLLGQLVQAMADKSADTFDTWMKQQSDLVQATAQAYADRETLEASIRCLAQVNRELSNPHPSPSVGRKVHFS